MNNDKINPISPNPTRSIQHPHDLTHDQKRSATTAELDDTIQDFKKKLKEDNSKNELLQKIASTRSIKIDGKNQFPPQLSPVVIQTKTTNQIASQAPSKTNLNLPNPIEIEARKAECRDAFLAELRKWDADHQSPSEKLMLCFINLYQNGLMFSKMFSNQQFLEHPISIDSTLCDDLSEKDWKQFFALFSVFQKGDGKQFSDKIQKTISTFQKKFPFPIKLYFNSVKTLTSSNLKELQLSQNLNISRSMNWQVWNSPENQSTDIVFHFGEKKLYACRAMIEKDLASFLKQYDSNTKEIDLSKSNLSFQDFETILKVNYNSLCLSTCVTIEQIMRLTKVISITRSDALLKYFNEVDINTKSIQEEKELEDYSKFLVEIEKSEDGNLFICNLQSTYDGIFEDFITMYAKSPFLYPQYGTWIKKYGSQVNALQLNLCGGISKALHLFFPCTKDFIILSVKEDDSLEMALDNIRMQLKILQIRYIPKQLSLADLEKCPNLYCFNMCQPNEDYDENQWIEIEPFKNPEKMTKLNRIFLRKVDLSNPQILKSISKLPALETLILIECKNIDIKIIEELLSKISSFELNQPFFETDSKSFLYVQPTARPVGINKISLNRLWNWEQKYPKALFKECVPNTSSQALASRWKEDLTDFKQVIKIKPVTDEQLLYVKSYNDIINDGKIFSILINQLYEQELLVYDFIEANQNLDKMRYMDILFYDHNHLNRQLGFVFNASPIKGVDGNMHIVTQGPTNKTIGDFWSAVWIMKTESINMLTACYVSGIEKCAQYWPSTLNQPITYQDALGRKFEVTLLKESHFSTIGMSRKFKLRTEEGERIIDQLQMIHWNDQTALGPDEIDELILSIYLREKNGSPSITHCSAGVGRTGVVIACLQIKKILPYLLHQTKDESNQFHPKLLHFDAEKLLVALRQQRMGMIQTGDQLYSVFTFFQREVRRLINKSKSK